MGTDDTALCDAVNAVIAMQGGISARDGKGNTQTLALPIAGLMSQLDGYTLAQTYALVDLDEKHAWLHFACAVYGFVFFGLTRYSGFEND